MSDAAGKTRVPLAQAAAIAAEARARLAPACRRIEVAGSIRRRRAEVADVELVAVPETLSRGNDLLGDPLPGEISLLDDLCRRLLGEGVLEHRRDKNGRPAFGAKFKRLVYHGPAGTLPLDLFVVTPPAQWGAVFAIRTGPGDFSKRLVTSRLQYPGYGLMPGGMREHEGSLWDGGRPVPTPEEEDFFAALGLVRLPPEQRTDDAGPARRGGPGR
jgi:DNA polymerase/3'-5' exonuclease PolX